MAPCTIPTKLTNQLKLTNISHHYVILVMFNSYSSLQGIQTKNIRAKLSNMGHTSVQP